MFKNINPLKVNLQWFAEEGDPAEGDPKGSEGEFLPFMAQMPDKHKERQDLNDMGSFGGIVDKYDEVVAERDQFKTATEAIEKPPEDIEGYGEFDKQDVVEGYERNPEVIKAFKEGCLKNGLTKAQANAVWLGIEKMTSDQYGDLIKKDTDTKKEEDEALKTDWGAKHAENMTKADRVKTCEAFKVDIEELEKSGVDITRPAMLKFLTSIHKHIAEDSLGQSSAPKGAPEVSDAEQKRIDFYGEKSPELLPGGSGVPSGESLPSGSVFSREEAKAQWPNSPELWPGE